MNFLQGIKECLPKENNIYAIEVSINSNELIVVLDCCYTHNDDDFERFKIPIQYDALIEDVTIPQDQFIKMYNVDEYGLDIDDLEVIIKIMKYLKDNSKEIQELCSSYGEPYFK